MFKKKNMLTIWLLIITLFFSGCSELQTNQQSNNQNQSASTQTDNNSEDGSSSSGNKKTRKTYEFRRESYLTEHYKKHGKAMGFSSEEEYLDAANDIINDPKSLQKNEAEDNDKIYFLQSTNEIVFVSQDGYIRTYFICRGKSYYDRQ